MSIALTVPERAQRVVASDLEIKILGACDYPSPLASASSRAQSTTWAKPIACCSTIASRSAAEFARIRPRARVRAGGAAPSSLLRPGQAALRHRDVRRAVPGLQQRGPRPGARAHARLRRPRILGFRYGYERPRRRATATSRSRSRPIGRRHPPRRRHGARHLARQSRRAARWSTAWRSSASACCSSSAATARCRGAMNLVAEIKRRGLPIGVIGIPKTIDNDIHFIDRSFGFETRVFGRGRRDPARPRRGQGREQRHRLRQMMGRHSGFIACHAALASTDVDFVLIPEVPVAARGRERAPALARAALARDSHAVIVVAEGAGQELCETTAATASAAPTRAATCA